MEDFILFLSKFSFLIFGLIVSFWLGVHRESKSKLWESKFESYKTLGIELNKMKFTFDHLVKSNFENGNKEAINDISNSVKESEVKALSAVAVGNLVFPRQVRKLIILYKVRLEKLQKEINKESLTQEERIDTFKNFVKLFGNNLCAFEYLARIDLANEMWNYDKYLLSILKSKWQKCKFFLFNRKPPSDADEIY